MSLAACGSPRPPKRKARNATCRRRLADIPNGLLAIFALSQRLRSNRQNGD